MKQLKALLIIALLSTCFLAEATGSKKKPPQDEGEGQTIIEIILDLIVKKEGN